MMANNKNLNIRSSSDATSGSFQILLKLICCLVMLIFSKTFATQKVLCYFLLLKAVKCFKPN